MKLIVLAPLIALALAGGSAGAYFWLSSEGSVEEAAIAQATPTPTPAEEAPPTPTPTPTPAPAPAEEGKAPDGCLEHELAYVDPDGRFAYCYPAEMELTARATQFGTAATVAYPNGQSNQVSLNIGGTVDPYEPCIIQSPTIIKSETISDFTIDQQTVEACFRDHYDRSQPDVLLHKSIDFMALTEDGRRVIVLVAYSGPEFERAGVPLEEVVMRILGSALIY